MSAEPATKSARPLVYLLPGVSRGTLARVIVGELVCRHKAPTSYFRILAALVEHAGDHSDIVWPCRIRQRDLATAAVPDDPVSTKTVSRALAYWKGAGLIANIKRGELTSGPSEHDWTLRGGRKRGNGPVGHYDLAGLKQHVPEELVAAFLALATGGQIPNYRAGRFKETARKPEGAPPVINLDILADPFEDQIVSAPPGFVSGTSHKTPPPSWNVRNTHQQNSPGQQKKPPLSSAPNTPFHGSKMSAKTPGSGGKNQVGGTQFRQGSGAWHILVAAREKGGRGFDVPGAKVLVKEMADRFGGQANAYQWIAELIEYARWEEQKSGEDKGPGWLLETARNWPGTWPAAYERHQERERKAALRAVRESLQAANQAARQVTTAPAPPTTNTQRLTPNTQYPIPDALAAAWPQMLADLKAKKIKEGDLRLVAGLAPEPPDAGTISLPCVPFVRQRIEPYRADMEASLTCIIGETVKVKFAPPLAKRVSPKRGGPAP